MLKILSILLVLGFLVGASPIVSSKTKSVLGFKTRIDGDDRIDTDKTKNQKLKIA